MGNLANSILFVGIVGGLAITLLGALAMLSIGLSRRLQREIGEHQTALGQLEAANAQLQRQLEEIQTLQAQLKEQAIRDGLTGLHNRRYFDETLPRELARAKREGYPLSVILIDIDRFKQINDTYGHAVGDEAIRILARLLREGAREGDVASRYGGEEFVVALPRMEREHAVARAEKWRQETENAVLRHGELEIRFTISAGVAEFPAHATELDALLAGADQALYRAKHNGRNRVELQPTAA